MHHRSIISKFSIGGLSIVVALLAVMGGFVARAQAGEKIPVRSSDELPRHTYKIEGTVSDLLQSDAKCAKLADLVRADIEADLAKYDIQDATTLKGLYANLMNIDMLADRFDDALKHLPKVRALEDKEATKLLMGSLLESMAAARKDAGSDDVRFRKTLRELYLKKLNALPWDVVGDQIEAKKGRNEMFSEELLLGIASGRLDPVIAKTGEASADIARGILGMKVALQVMLPLKDDLGEVYGAVVAANRVEKVDIWAARSAALPAGKNHSPVTVAIWDTGTDASLFPGQLFVNPKEKVDGKDTDGNGFVDDVNGIAYDLHSNRSSGMLRTIDELESDVDTVFTHLKGFTDMQAAVDSPEASAVKKVFGSLKQDKVKTFIEDLTLGAHYMHGTHVAGIAVEGNPYARILVARFTADHHMIPEKPTIELAYQAATSMRDTVAYFKQHGARVVNMSWGEDRASIEAALEANGVGETPEKRAELARTMFKITRDALYKAIDGAPEILFVNAAGNSDDNVEFEESSPASFDLPNILVVGAVDQAGDPTDFTSFGSNVQMYANGFEVDSYLPGGKRMKASGTSMSSPNAANLAAKILAINPKLKPSQVIDLMKRGADSKQYGTATLLLMNPKRTLGLM